jgi:lysozyme
VIQQGFVLLSDADTDAPACPAVATVSTLDQQWDSGGWALGAAAAAAGRTWVDRPYFTGNPTVAWLVGRANEVTRAGGFCQLGNELNLEMEGFQGGPEAWFQLEEAVLAVVERPDRCLAMPPSPGVPGWQEWVSPTGPYAVHAYGSSDQMRQVVEWYLEATSEELFVTELNFGAGNVVDVDTWATVDLVAFLDWCATQPRVRFASYFCWRWRTPDSALTTPVDAAGTAIEVVVRDWTPPDPPNPGPEEPMLEGVDASNWQGPAVDWAAVAASGRRFAIVKASEDGDYRDPTFVRNWAAIKEAGLVRGAYHFARPSTTDPADSVALFAEQIAAAGGLATGDLVALDLEDTNVAPDEQLAAWALDWLELAEADLGVRPLLYSGLWFMAPHGLDTIGLAAYPLWLAAYQEAVPAVPESWDEIAIHQYSAHGSVPGIAGDADLNRFLGDEVDLAALGYGPQEAFDVDGARDQLWRIAEDLERNGWPWFGQSVKSAVALSKGEG